MQESSQKSVIAAIAQQDILQEVCCCCCGWFLTCYPPVDVICSVLCHWSNRQLSCPAFAVCTHQITVTDFCVIDFFYLFSHSVYIVAFAQNVFGTEWLFMCWCAVKKLFTHSLTLITGSKLDAYRIHFFYFFIFHSFDCRLHLSGIVDFAECDHWRNTFTALADPGMAGPGGGPQSPLTKSSGCRKRSALDTGASGHLKLNPQFLPPLLYENGQ